MPKTISYFEQRDNDNTQLIRKMLSTLPMSCSDFIRNIESMTSTLTRIAYLRDLKLFFEYLTHEVPEFSDKQIAAISDRDLDAITGRQIDLYGDYLTLYYKDDDTILKNGEQGKMRKLSALRSYFQYMFKNHRISSNVATLIDLPKLHEKLILRLDSDEVSQLLNVVETGTSLTKRQQKWHDLTKTRDIAIIKLFLGTGIRVSECVGLDIQDINIANNSFLVRRKGGDQVILYYPDEVAEALIDYLNQREQIEAQPNDENALFLSMQKKRMTVRSMEYLVKKYALIAAPLKTRFSPHKLRSTYGTNLYRATGDIYLVADQLGHSDVNTTRKHYAAMTDDRRRMAAQYVVLDGRKADADQTEDKIQMHDAVSKDD